jgi:hypothetical protein
MADHDAPAEDVPGVDFSEHVRTYDGFVALTIISILHTITILLALVMFGFGGAGSFWLGVITVFLAVGSAAIGIARGGTWRPAAWILGLAAILALFSLS